MAESAPLEDDLVGAALHSTRESSGRTSQPLRPAALPPLARSLMKIPTPVVATLARARLRVGQIVSLAPGSLIHFTKRCDETLELEISGHVIAHGEAVKVGDKFGLRVTSIKLPDERFHPVRPPKAS